MAEKRSPKKKEKGEKVCEAFDVKEKGKEKEIVSCGNLPTKHASKKELGEENKVLRNVLIFLAVFAIIFIVTSLMIKESNTVEYEGVTFNKIDYSGLPFYHTTFIFPKNGENILYNEYLRLNPDETVAKIPFEGALMTRREMVMNFEEEFNCDGDGIIGASNLRDLYDFLGIKVVKNESYGCDIQGRYLYLNFVEGDESKIVQVAPTCYTLYVNNCEILDVTERFMIEALVKVNKELNEQAS